MDGVLGLGRSLKVLATCPPAQGSPLDAPERRVGVDLLVFDTSLPDLACLTLTAEFAAAPKMRSVGKPIGGAGERVAGQSETELQPGESISENRIDGVGALVRSPPRELKSTRQDGVGGLDLNDAAAGVGCARQGGVKPHTKLSGQERVLPTDAVELPAADW